MIISSNMAIYYAIKVLAIKSPNEAIEFLDHWDQEEYEIIKQKWKDIPKELYSNE